MSHRPPVRASVATVINDPDVIIVAGTPDGPLLQISASIGLEFYVMGPYRCDSKLAEAEDRARMFRHLADVAQQIADTYTLRAASLADATPPAPALGAVA